MGAIMDSSSGMKNNGPLDEKGKNIEMFYPAQSERSRANIANISQLQLISGGFPQPSETSTNNLMYSQSIKINDIESTIHNVNNQSIMQSEFEQRVIDKMIQEESEKLMKNHSEIEKEQELLRKIKNMNIIDQKQASARLLDEQKKAMIAMGKDLGNLFALNKMSQVNNLCLNADQRGQHDDSINFSNLESSIAPSYNDSINKQGREKQY